jgi:hypothetical protein
MSVAARVALGVPAPPVAVASGSASPVVPPVSPVAAASPAAGPDASAAPAAAPDASPVPALPTVAGSTQVVSSPPPRAPWAPPDGSGGAVRTAFGKPLVWTSGWTVVVAIWALVAVFLVVVRVEMGHLEVLSPTEKAAVAAVEAARLPDGTTYGDALVYQANNKLSATGAVVPRTGGPRPRWYAFERPWEHRVYVSWEMPGVGLYEWTVDGTTVKAAAETQLDLRKVSELMRNPPPAPVGLPQVPDL